MKTPFRLDEHPRRVQPLAPPPPGYFDALPRRVMARAQPAATETVAGWQWLAALSGPVRTALASGVVLGGFALSFVLNGTTPPTLPSGALASVPQAELVQYLLASDSRLTLNDLAELPGSDELAADTYLHASPDELQAALDAQPIDDTYL